MSASAKLAVKDGLARLKIRSVAKYRERSEAVSEYKANESLSKALKQATDYKNDDKNRNWNLEVEYHNYKEKAAVEEAALSDLRDLLETKKSNTSELESFLELLKGRRKAFESIDKSKLMTNVVTLLEILWEEDEAIPQALKDSKLYKHIADLANQFYKKDYSKLEERLRNWSVDNAKQKAEAERDKIRKTVKQEMHDRWIKKYDEKKECIKKQEEEIRRLQELVQKHVDEKKHVEEREYHQIMIKNVEDEQHQKELEELKRFKYEQEQIHRIEIQDRDTQITSLQTSQTERETTYRASIGEYQDRIAELNRTLSKVQQIASDAQEAHEERIETFEESIQDLRQQVDDADQNRSWAISQAQERIRFIEGLLARSYGLIQELRNAYFILTGALSQSGKSAVRSDEVIESLERDRAMLITYSEDANVSFAAQEWQHNEAYQQAMINQRNLYERQTATDQEVIVLESHLQCKADDIIGLNTRLEELRMIRVAKDKEVEDLQMEKQNNDVTIIALRKEITSCERNIKELNAQQHQLTGQTGNLTTEVDGLQKSLKHSRKETDTKATEMKQYSEHMQGRIEKLHQHIRTLNSEKDSLSDTVNKNSRNSETQSARLKILQKETDDAKAQIRTHVADLEVLRSQWKSEQGEARRLRSELIESQNRLKDRNEMIKNFERSSNASEQTYTLLQQAKSRLDTKIKQLESDVNNRDEQIMQHKETIDEYGKIKETNATTIATLENCLNTDRMEHQREQTQAAERISQIESYSNNALLQFLRPEAMDTFKYWINDTWQRSVLHDSSSTILHTGTMIRYGPDELHVTEDDDVPSLADLCRVAIVHVFTHGPFHRKTLQVLYQVRSRLGHNKPSTDCGVGMIIFSRMIWNHFRDLDSPNVLDFAHVLRCMEVLRLIDSELTRTVLREMWNDVRACGKSFIDGSQCLGRLVQDLMAFANSQESGTQPIQSSSSSSGIASTADGKWKLIGDGADSILLERVNDCQRVLLLKTQLYLNSDPRKTDTVTIGVRNVSMTLEFSGQDSLSQLRTDAPQIFNRNEFDPKQYLLELSQIRQRFRDRMWKQSM